MDTLGRVIHVNGNSLSLKFSRRVAGALAECSAAGTPPILVFNTLGIARLADIAPIRDAIRESRVRVTGRIEGRCCAAGLYLFLLCEPRVLVADSFVQFGPIVPIDELDDEDLDVLCASSRHDGKVLSMVNTQVVWQVVDEMRARLPRFTKEEVLDLMVAERLFSHTDALEAGIATSLE